MQVELGQPVVVEPKPGGNSTLATAMIPQSPADGYNWVMATISHVVVPHPAAGALRRAGRLPAGGAGRRGDFGRHRESRRAGQDAEGAGRVRQRPIRASSTTSTRATARRSISSAELLKNQYKFDMTSVPYRGIPPGMPDLLEGRLQVGLLPGPLAIQHVQSGKLRALAVLADKRAADPARRADLRRGRLRRCPGHELVRDRRAGRHAGSHRRAAACLGDEGPAATRDPRPTDQGRLRGAGSPARPPTCWRLWKADYARYGKLVKEAGIKGES